MKDLNLATQTLLFPELAAQQPVSDAVSSTFADNMRLPVHRWIRYSAGFSGAWAKHVIEKYVASGEVRVFDPFAGSGTTLIAAEDAGVSSVGIEAHPFVYRIASAKLARRSNLDEFRAKVQAIRAAADKIIPELERYPKLVRACYSDDALAELDRLRKAISATDDGSPASRLGWLALVGILRRCSSAGTAQWQYVLPKKSKKVIMHPQYAFNEFCQMMLMDMAACSRNSSSTAKLLQTDARDCNGVPDRYATLVLTSPPYPNNYDYADATRLEMCFFQEISGWKDLQATVRQYLVRSCSQHVPERAINIEQVLADPVLDPIRSEIVPICQELANVRLSKGGKKTYHLMVACYFLDLARVWHALRRVCDSPSEVCFVIGDSAPYGVYVPVIDWLGRLAEAAGFGSIQFDRTRDRNVKWKNRKHRVPLCEGRLWVKG